MNLIPMMIIISTMLSLILIIISFWLPMNNPALEKLSPYECGFDPLGSARLPFSIRFFLIAILFLLFDLEIALLLPTPWASQSLHPQLTLIWSTAILVMLSIGLMEEWTKGGLEWAE